MSDKIPSHDLTENPMDEDHYAELDWGDGKIYTRRLREGFYRSLRQYTGIPLLLAYFLIPWFSIDGRPAMFFNLPEREFHVFWMTFWPQDGMLLAWLLIISAFALFAVTTLVGRVWCGFTCPQTVWTLMFIWWERRVIGDRNAQMKLDNAPWDGKKIVKKLTKWFGWFVIAFATAVAFVGYFTPVQELVPDLIMFQAHPWAAFWVAFFTLATFGNAGFLREKVCKYMCPYARFQSVMYDEDTLLVTYDAARGEKRGPRKPGNKPEGMGDCIDCKWCVQVCPVGIDIRDGLQYPCIDCGLCVDACNQIMDKMSYERGLIRFTTQDQLENGHTKFIRPKLVGYVVAVVVMMLAFVYVLSARVPVTLDVVRDRGQLFRPVGGREIENTYMLKINNMSDSTRYFSVHLQEKEGFVLKGWKRVEVEKGEVFSLPVSVRAKRTVLDSSKTPVFFRIEAEDNAEIFAEEDSTFIGPSK